MIDKQRLHGHWRLVSFVEQQADGTWADYLGADAQGSISYWPNGQMQVLIGAADRPRLRGEWSAVPAGQKAACLDRMVAYAGRFEVQDDRVVHHVAVCWIPNWEGRELVRLVEFPATDRLLLRTTAGDASRPRPMQEVLWERSQ